MQIPFWNLNNKVDKSNPSFNIKELILMISLICITVVLIHNVTDEIVKFV